MTKEDVVLLHGLARTTRSMRNMEKFLSFHGYRTWNIGYPSTKEPIENLAAQIRYEVISRTSDAEKVHFVTHSMGGIIVRTIQKNDRLPHLGRVVMLSPPNKGSEIVDAFGRTWLFRIIHGPAGSQLGTDSNGLPSELGPVDFELGVITGDRSINWINSLIILGKNDGKVSIERARVDGMTDYLVVHATHPYIMRNKKVMVECLAFLKYGRFSSSIRDMRARS
jgi:pimeloyl-ACP methyl ester carboxylesterase